VRFCVVGGSVGVVFTVVVLLGRSAIKERAARPLRIFPSLFHPLNELKNICKTKKLYDILTLDFQLFYQVACISLEVIHLSNIK
jgi:hypothetical protein